MLTLKQELGRAENTSRNGKVQMKGVSSSQLSLGATGVSEDCAKSHLEVTYLNWGLGD